jgi:DNA polymerase III subunit epsilon
VDYQSGDVLFNSLLHPSTLDIYETSRAREVSGISTMDLLQAPPLWKLWPDVLDILQAKPVTAFNADFDIRMIRNSLIKWDSGIGVPALEATCLMKIITAYHNLDYWVSLEEAAKYFGIVNTNSHRALADVLTTVEIVRKMKEDTTNGK